MLQEIKEIEDEHKIEVIGLLPSNCQIDGKYAPVQENSTQLVIFKILFH